MKMKSEQEGEVKRLTKDPETATKRVDPRVEKKLDHELSIQKLRNKSKHLKLDLVREKMSKQEEASKQEGTPTIQNQKARPTHSL